MLPETDSAPAADRTARDYLAEYARHQMVTGRGNSSTTQGAKTFMRQWPHPQDWASQPLAKRLAEGPQTNSFLIFLMVHGWLQPGYDYLVARKLSSFWREIVASPLLPARSRGDRVHLGHQPPRGFSVHRSSSHRDQREPRGVDPRRLR